ncbi:glycosyltransferase family 4 protein [Agarivorans sp. TSD2052]|uniref:glycosyltransferase n=1 Tax=Agarivorans sp. TSD2052 TaxID=2937286 RepID=UPI00200FC41C|nr:glycosyltransferase family 4 protein [Agarivorans sp. TSD2052]UPW20070.1 glycosyltransferase family 4 protein [Agarivorans sp. TSD2052]
MTAHSCNTTAKGHIDSIDSGRINGWFYDPLWADTPEFFLAIEDQVIKAVPDIYRADLAEAGFANGVCAFSVLLEQTYQELAGKVIRLQDIRQNAVSEALIDDDRYDAITLQLEGLEAHQLVFNYAGVELGAYTTILYCNGAPLATTEHNINAIDGTFVISLPAHFVRPDKALYQLAIKGFPCFVWQSDISDNTNNPNRVIPTKIFAATDIDITGDRIKGLSKALRTTQLSDKKKRLIPTAYSVLTGHQNCTICLPAVLEPKVTLILPPFISAADAKMMISSVILTLLEASYEIIWITNTPEAFSVNNLVTLNCNDQYTSAMAKAINAAKGELILFCPYVVEFGLDAIPQLISTMEASKDAFVCCKVVDRNGLTHGNDLHSPIPSERVMSANHPAVNFTQTVRQAIHSCSIYRTKELAHIMETADPVCAELLIQMWQTKVTTDKQVGVYLGNACVYSAIDFHDDSFMSKKIDVMDADANPPPSIKPLTAHFKNEVSLVTKKLSLGTILMLDVQTPSPDKDAGSYAAIQEIGLMQRLGYQVIFVPIDLKYSNAYTKNLQNSGVEVCYSPHYNAIADFIDERLKDISAFYITRYNVAAHFIEFLKKAAPAIPIIFNNADLHFLREVRAALSTHQTDGERQIALAKAHQTKTAELEVMRNVDAILSYNETEHAVICSHLFEQKNIFKCPWVLEPKPQPLPFDDRDGVAFLGGFKHTPNIEAIEFFIEQLMPLFLARSINVKLYIYGSHMPEKYKDLGSSLLEGVGYIENLDDVFQKHRVFIAPLLSGAGIKGKVLESAAYGLPSVLSPIAAESTGLSHNVSTLIAETPEQWVNHIMALHNERALWERISQNARALAEEQYSSKRGLAQMAKVFHFLNLTTTFDTES